MYLFPVIPPDFVPGNHERYPAGTGDEPYRDTGKERKLLAVDNIETLFCKRVDKVHPEIQRFPDGSPSTGIEFFCRADAFSRPFFVLCASRAASDADWSDCKREDGDEAKIIAASRASGKKRSPPRERAIALNNRGNAYQTNKSSAAPSPITTRRCGSTPNSPTPISIAPWPLRGTANTPAPSPTPISRWTRTRRSRRAARTRRHLHGERQEGGGRSRLRDRRLHRGDPARPARRDRLLHGTLDHAAFTALLKEEFAEWRRRRSGSSRHYGGVAPGSPGRTCGPLLGLGDQIPDRHAGRDLFLAQFFGRGILRRARQHLARPFARNEADAGLIGEHEVAGFHRHAFDRHRLVDGDGLDARLAGDQQDQTETRYQHTT